jgi:hypothetical protein
MAAPDYLRPYLEAVARHGAGFDSLLWANPSAQAARFAALARWSELGGRVVLDAGCGRADFLVFLLEHNIRPSRYIGIEAVEALAEAAEVNAKGQREFESPGGPHPDPPPEYQGRGKVRSGFCTPPNGNASIVHGDFIRNPGLLDQNADVIVFCGSLNTLSKREFYDTLGLAWKKTRSELAFNFLCSPRLASGEHLNWYAIGDVQQFAMERTRDIAIDDGYRDGDCTMVMRKTGQASFASRS